MPIAPRSPESQVFDVEECDDVYASYTEAKGKLNAMRTSRGFYPVVAMIDKQHFHESPTGGKPKGKSSKGKAKGKSPPKGKRPDPREHGAAAAMGTGKRLCLRCGASGHLARNCPSQSDMERGSWRRHGR